MDVLLVDKSFQWYKVMRFSSSLLCIYVRCHQYIGQVAQVTSQMLQLNYTFIE